MTYVDKDGIPRHRLPTLRRRGLREQRLQRVILKVQALQPLALLRPDMIDDLGEAFTYAVVWPSSGNPSDGVGVSAFTVSTVWSKALRVLQRQLWERGLESL